MLQSLQAIKEVVVTLAALSGAVIAALGLRTWRRQLKGHTEYELARRFLRAVYRVRDAIGAVRHPLMSVGEMAAAAESSGQRGVGNEASHSDFFGAAYNKRWSHLQSAISDLSLEAVEAEVVWGKEGTAVVDPLYRCIAELRVSLELFLRDRQEERDDRLDSDHRRKLEAVVYSTSRGDAKDEFDTKVSGAVLAAETFLRPKLKI